MLRVSGGRDILLSGWQNTKMKKHKKAVKRNTAGSLAFLQKPVHILFVCIFLIILMVVLCFSWVPYCLNISAVFPNAICLLVGGGIGLVLYKMIQRIPISDRTFKIIIVAVFLILLAAQAAIVTFAYFDTGWDVQALVALSNHVVQRGPLPTGNYYLSLYPNNTFLVAVMSLIKMVPIFGGKRLFLLGINALLVNLSGLLACLTIKKLTSKKAAIFSIFIIVPLLVLSPWIIIPYSDTFAVLFPILIFYIYISKKKKWWRYLLLSFLSVVGFFIKPTVIIMLIAIGIAELLHCNKWKITKERLQQFALLSAGAVLALALNVAGTMFIGFVPDKMVQSASMVHYLAMGQNEEMCGMYLGQDVTEMRYGPKFELEKFVHRVSTRDVPQQLNFFTKKLLINFNDGTFAWSVEGNFYYIVPERDRPISVFLTNYFYNYGNNYAVFATVVQIVWVLVLFGCVFIRQTDKSSLALQLALIGMFLFVMLFEARARYLFCYAPIFIVCATMGLYALLEKVRKLHK